MACAIFPGTFDPITNGHIELIQRASLLVGQLIVAVAASPNKNTLFSLSERVALVEESVKHIPGITVIGYDQLMAEFVKTHGATILIRGVRSLVDFEYERQMAEMNQALNAKIETLFLMASLKTSFISSSIVREVAAHHGDVTAFVPVPVRDALLSKMSSR